MRSPPFHKNSQKSVPEYIYHVKSLYRGLLRMWCLADDESTSLHENNNGAGKSYAEEDTCMSHEEKDTCLRGNDNGAGNRNLGRRHTLYQCMYACMCVRVCVCVYVCKCTCVYSVSVCMCIRVFVYVCIYQNIDVRACQRLRRRRRGVPEHFYHHQTRGYQDRRLPKKNVM